MWPVRARIVGKVESSRIRTFTSSSGLPPSASTITGGLRAMTARPASNSDAGRCSSISWRRCAATVGRDQARLRVGRCDPRLGGLDRLRRRGLLRAQPLDVIVGPGRDLLEPRQLGVRRRLFRARAFDLRIERFASRWRQARLPRAAGKGARRRPRASLILRDDRDGWQGSTSPGTIARPASPGPANAARSHARTIAAGPRCRVPVRRGRPRRRSGSGLRACRRRATIRASWRNRSKTAPVPRSSSTVSTALAGVAGILPPRSGSSVTLVGHAIRFR